MVDVRGGHLSGQVLTDNQRFIECTFEHCQLIYSGLGPVAFEHCIFNDCHWTFSGPASNTIQFLKALASPESGLKDLFDQILQDIQAVNEAQS